MLRKVFRDRLIAVCALLAAGGMATCARGADVLADIPFASPGAPGNVLLLNLYLPSGGVSPNGYTIVLVHGGSYVTGSRTDLSDICAALADQGFAVVDPDYTLVTADNVASYPQPITDVLNAVHWIRTDGEQLHLPNRVIISGISAGSTIAMTAALSASTTVFNRLPAPAHRGYTIDGTIGVMGRYDLVWNAWIGIPETVINYLGVPLWRPDWVQVWNQASAISYVNADSPPTVLFHGGNDMLVPNGNSIRLNQALQMAGAPAQLNIVPGGGHDMSILGWTAQQQAATLAAAAGWIDANPTTPPAMGACCDPATGACTSTTQSGCATPWVPSIACEPNPCPQPPPPPPMGACCATSGACAARTEAQCAGLWVPNFACEPNPCPQPPPMGSCCATSGTCGMVQQSACAGNWTEGGACVPNPCPQPSAPTGACCMGATCAVATAAQCAGPNHRFTGADVACNAGGGAGANVPCCHADFNQNGTVAVSDIFDFLTAWFAGAPESCITSPVTSAPTVQDIFDFLTAWFGGC